MRAAIAERLETIPVLARRVHGVAELAKLAERGSLAQVGAAAFVIPAGMRGGAADAATGLYRQSLDRLIGVVVAIRNVSDATGEKALIELEPLIENILQLLAGWAPEDAFGVLGLVRGELLTVANGTIQYQLDFAIEDQLRIERP